MAIAIALGWPPTANTHWRRAGHRIYLSARGREFREDAAAHCASVGVAPMDGRLAVSIELTPPDARKWDIDNRIKPTLDALIGWAFFDDSQIDLLHVVRRRPESPGRCLVVVSEIEEPAV